MSKATHITNSGRRSAQRLLGLILPFALSVACASLARADLSAVVGYSCGGIDCTIDGGFVGDSDDAGVPITVGDTHGGASAEADYGQLTGAAAGSWLPASSPPDYYSSGEVDTYFTDNITFTSLSSGSIDVTLVLELTGSLVPAESYTTGYAVVDAHVQQDSQYSYVSLYGGALGSGSIQVGSVVSFCEWSSADGLFTPGYSAYANPAIAGTLTTTFSVPLNTASALFVALNINGNNSASGDATATLSFDLPPGVTISSAAGATYNLL